MKASAGNKWVTVVTVVCVFLVSQPGRATSIYEMKLRCPVCSHKFKTNAVGSTNNFGGQDADLYVRATGDSPLTFYPKVCPKCSYAGYRFDFGDTIKFSDSTKASLKSKLSNHAMTKGQLANSIREAWLSYEQVAYTYEILGRPAKDLAYAHICASWCVRELKETLPGIPDDMRRAATHYADSIVSTRDSWRGNRAAGEVKVGREIAGEVLVVPAIEDFVAPLAAIRLLREHGEYVEVLSLLPLLKPLLSPEVFESFNDSMRATIELERRYQRLALHYYSQAVAKMADSGQSSIFLYLEGELNRRLGHDQSARRCYEAVTRLENLPEDKRWVSDLAKEQLKLVDTAAFDSSSVGK